MGALVGAVSLVWLLRGFDFQRFRVVLAQVDLRFLLLLPVIIIVEQVVRAWKWRQLLWPLRSIGTIARSWLVARREDLKLTAVLATAALDLPHDRVLLLGPARGALVGGEELSGNRDALVDLQAFELGRAIFAPVLRGAAQA